MHASSNVCSLFCAFLKIKGEFLSRFNNGSTIALHIRKALFVGSSLLIHSMSKLLGRSLLRGERQKRWEGLVGIVVDLSVTDSQATGIAEKDTLMNGKMDSLSEFFLSMMNK